jgi:hypothetical protein
MLEGSKWYIIFRNVSGQLLDTETKFRDTIPYRKILGDVEL